MDWEAAEKHVKTTLGYYQELVGQPGVIAGFGILYLESLLRRYNSGERTEELYSEMKECQ